MSCHIDVIDHLFEENIDTPFHHQIEQWQIELLLSSFDEKNPLLEWINTTQSETRSLSEASLDSTRIRLCLRRAPSLPVKNIIAQSRSKSSGRLAIIGTLSEFVGLCYKSSSHHCLLMCWCADAMACYWCFGVLLLCMCWCWSCWCCCYLTLLMCWWVDVLMCWCVDVWCVDVLMWCVCWCVDVLMCWCVDVLMCRWCIDVVSVEFDMLLTVDECDVLIVLFVISRAKELAKEKFGANFGCNFTLLLHLLPHPTHSTHTPTVCGGGVGGADWSGVGGWSVCVKGVKGVGRMGAGVEWQRWKRGSGFIQNSTNDRHTTHTHLKVQHIALRCGGVPKICSASRPLLLARSRRHARLN